MTRYARPVQALYDALGGWKEVSDACAVNGRVYSPGCYWNIAEGKTHKPTLAVRKAILAGIARTPECASLAVNASLATCRRGNVSYTISLWNSMQKLRRDLGESWEEFGQASLDARKRELRDA